MKNLKTIAIALLVAFGTVNAQTKKKLTLPKVLSHGWEKK